MMPFTRLFGYRLSLRNIVRYYYYSYLILLLRLRAIIVIDYYCYARYALPLLRRCFRHAAAALLPRAIRRASSYVVTAPMPRDMPR